MKKTLKGIFAIAFVFTLIFGMGMTVYADTPEYKITVENKNSNISISGKVYKAYKVFDLTLGSITYSQATEYAANQTYYVYDSNTNKYTAANITESEFNNGTYYTISVGAYAYTVKAPIGHLTRSVTVQRKNMCKHRQEKLQIQITVTIIQKTVIHTQ